MVALDESSPLREYSQFHFLSFQVDSLTSFQISYCLFETTKRRQLL